MQFNNRDDIIALTPSWTGERFPDGRPKVPDRYLDALYGMTDWRTRLRLKYWICMCE